MRRTATTTPIWVKLSIAIVLTATLGWWVLDRADRIGNQNRLSGIASQIAGRDVSVRCPGPIGRALGEEAESWRRYVAMVELILRTS